MTLSVPSLRGVVVCGRGGTSWLFGFLILGTHCYIFICWWCYTVHWTLSSGLLHCYCGLWVFCVMFCVTFCECSNADKAPVWRSSFCHYYTLDYYTLYILSHFSFYVRRVKRSVAWKLCFCSENSNFNFFMFFLVIFLKHLLQVKTFTSGECVMTLCCNENSKAKEENEWG